MISDPKVIICVVFAIWFIFVIKDIYVKMSFFPELRRENLYHFIRNIECQPQIIRDIFIGDILMLYCGIIIFDVIFIIYIMVSYIKYFMEV